MQRPTTRQAAIVLIPLAALVLALALRAAVPTVVVASPSPTPTPTPTVQITTAAPTPSPSPSPSPTPSPTVAQTRQPTPEPTISYLAGEKMLPFYFEIRQMFPVMPPTPVLLPDEQFGGVENAVFHGLDAQGQPQFAVRHDFVMDKGTAAHEFGHAYQKVIEKQDPSRDVLALYWAFRGFPGTWQQADQLSKSQPSASAAWTYSPQESWAEAFRAGVMLEVKEKTLDYGKTIDPAAARQFFLSLAKK